ncbi:MAG: hypothetical protein AOA65_1067 [Candidatus Bathyarchaeota archaeon BA1]|nr:MAG: hypothetical protein AOA65_1067 [Candidatus Bathyarchaeota archaeon BA1]
MRKCLPLNLLEPTKTKKMLKETYTLFFRMVKEALGIVGDAQSRAQLHERAHD